MQGQSQNRANSFSGYGEFIFKNNKDKEDTLKYNIQDFELPGYALPGVQITKGKDGSIPGNKVQKDLSITLQFILDEQLLVYTNLIDLIQYYSELMYSEDNFILMIQDNKSNFILKYDFYNSWISSISGIKYSTKEGETTIYVDVTLEYLDADYTRLGE